jgi:hypothetical protein
MDISWSNPLIVILWIFGWAAFVLAIIYMTHRKRQKTLDLIHKERLAAIEKGIPISEWPDYDINGKGSGRSSLFAPEESNPRGALGAGAILIMIGVGISAAFYLWRGMRILWPVGLIIVFTGIGVVLSYFLTREKKS